MRGIMKRVASKVGVDPSLVSRVIHGERKSPEMLEALRDELKLVRDYLNEALDEE
jgi:transcriptional regulator with XRE-family HTH domain